MHTTNAKRVTNVCTFHIEIWNTHLHVAAENIYIRKSYEGNLDTDV